jgi:hypothetical protein
MVLYFRILSMVLYFRTLPMVLYFRTLPMMLSFWFLVLLCRGLYEMNVSTLIYHFSNNKLFVCRRELIYVICVCFPIVMFSTYCLVLFVFVSS